MSGMGDGYVGTAQDAVRIRRLEKQREAERRKIQELKAKTASAKGQPGLLQFGSSTSEVLIQYPYLCLLLILGLLSKLFRFSISVYLVGVPPVRFFKGFKGRK